MNSQTNKSEEENDKIVTLKFNYSNAKSKSKTFGEIELKYISAGDLIFFVKLLDKVKDDKEFVTQVLYHQLTTLKGVSGFEPSALRQNPASQDFKYARKVRQNRAVWLKGK